MHDRNTAVLPDGDDVEAGAARLSPAQLTAILHRSGALRADDRVTAVRSAALGLGESMMSRLERLDIDYERGGGPASLVLKLPCDDPGRRSIADRFGFYAREVRFYADIAPLVPVRTPRCHLACIDPEGTGFSLLLEDVDDGRCLGQVDGCSWDDAAAVVDGVVPLHAAFWDRSAFLRDKVPAVDAHAQVENAAAVFAAGWPTARALAGHRMPDEVLRLGDRWERMLGAMAGRLATPATLCHGDLRLDNVRVRGDELVLFDFQLLTLANGVSDIAYFACQSIRPHCRAGRDRELVDRYLAGLDAHGVTYDRDDAWDAYLTALVLMLVFPVALYRGYADLPPAGQRLTDAMLDRNAAAIVDTRAWEADVIAR